MIALINFTKDLFIPRQDATNLNLQYEEVGKIGVNYQSNIERMTTSYYYYKDELIKNEEDGRYYKDDKKIDNYYVYDRVKDGIDYVYVKSENHIVDLLEFAPKCNYSYSIQKCIKSKEPTVQNIQSLLSIIEEKTEAINKTIDIMSNQTFNQKCNVHVGGGLIATYNDLMLKEDSCTDALQSELNNGWRIIAVCVQPDQRRPDYVLGRYNPELDTYRKNSAER
jgi:hypothetical protein